MTELKIPSDAVKQFDAIIVGAGQAGPPLAARLTEAGKTVALVERGQFGGTCVNVGCTPTKTMVASAYVARLAARAKEFGVFVSQRQKLDLSIVKARADKIVLSYRTGIENTLEAMKGCTVFRGHARFESPHTIRVGHELISAKNIFLNVGGRAVIPDLPGLDKIAYMTNSGILALTKVPRHLVIVGGSYIGLEFAQMFRRFGARVTVVERAPRLLPTEDEVVSDSVKQVLEREGITVRLKAECVEFTRRAAGMAISVDRASGGFQVAASHLLLAVGRRANTDDLGLERAGVEVDARGYIVVDDRLRTNVEGVFALGDCNGRGAFTHTAYNDFEIVADNLLDGRSRSVADRIPAYALFIDPPLARVGMSETQARKAGYEVRIGERAMTHVARAVEKGEDQGFMRFVIDAGTNKILGATIFGPGGDEAIHGVLNVMSLNAPYTDLAHTMPIHPTVSELVPTVLSELSNDRR